MMVPYTIRTIIEQSGGRGPRGAFAYVGGTALTYSCPQSEREERPGYASCIVNGTVDFGVGLIFAVNGKRGEQWHMIVAYEPSDCYTVWLVRRATPTEWTAGQRGAILDHARDVYCDQLQSVIEAMYDAAIAKHCQGFIPA